MKKNSLKNKSVLLTRKENGSLPEELEALGAEVIELPLIDIELDADKEIANDILSNIATYQWLVFSSANGVRGFFKQFFKKYRDIRCIGQCRVAAVGKKTAEELAKFYIESDVIPETSDAQNLAKAVMEFETIENLMILNIAGNLQDGALAKILQDDGHAIVDTFPVYKTSIVEIAEDSAAALYFAQNGADAIFFASPSAVQGFVKNVKSLKLKDGAKHPKAFSIGARTSEEMKKHGITVAAEAASPDAIIEMFEAHL